MAKANKILEAEQSDSQTVLTRLREKTSRKTDIPTSWVSALFKRFQARYGHRWVSAIDGIEEVAVEEWRNRLSGVTGEQIKHGLESWDGDWPPSSEEFKKACNGRQTNEFGLDYIPECYRQQPERSRDRLLSSSNSLKPTQPKRMNDPTPAVYGTWWPDNRPPRYYAGVIVRLRPDLRDEALCRVPESIRGLVKTHIESFARR